MPEGRSGIADVTVFTHHDEFYSDVEIRRHAKRNALSIEVLDGLLRSIEECEESNRRVVLLRGSGAFFSAGADLAEMTGTIEDRRWLARLDDLTSRMTSSPLIVIAVIEGGCLGAGLELATACDVRVASPSTYFALPALEMGLVYQPYAVERLRGLAGHAVTSRMILLGEQIGGLEARDCGLVTILADEGRAHENARAIAHRVAELPVDGLGTTTRMLASLLGRQSTPGHWIKAHLNSTGSPERYAAVANKRGDTARRERA